MRLCERELRGLLSAAADLAEVDAPEHFPPVAFAAVRAIVGCDFVIYNEMWPLENRSLVLGDPQETLDLFNSNWEEHMHEHPVLARWEATGDDSTHSICELLPQRAFRRTALWADVYRPIGVDDQLAAFVRTDTRLVGVSANSSGRFFDERDRDLLDALRPFLRAAHRRAELELLADPGLELDGYGLTERERQVLALAVRGYTNREIASDFFVSARTVAKHLEHAYKKLGVHTRREATRLVADTLKGPARS